MTRSCGSKSCSSLPRSSLTGPCKILYRSLWEALAGILWNCPQKVLVVRSWRRYALVLFWGAIEGPSSILWNSLRCPGMRCWYEVLKSRYGAASCAKTSCCCTYDHVYPDLLLFHNYCLYLVHWFPVPHTVWICLGSLAGAIWMRKSAAWEPLRQSPFDWLPHRMMKNGFGPSAAFRFRKCRRSLLYNKRILRLQLH